MKLLAILISLVSFSVSYSSPLIIGTSKYNPPFEPWITKSNQYYAYGFDSENLFSIFLVRDKGSSLAC